MYMASGYALLRALSDKQELSLCSGLVHAELQSAACRADLVSARGFHYRVGVTYSLVSVCIMLYLHGECVCTFKGYFRTKKSNPRRRPSAS